MVDTRELRYFVAVAEELHFGRAAERLLIAQPALSRAIQRLERRLGVLLLERDRRGVAMTAAGEVLLEEARVALDAVASAVRRTQRAAGPNARLLLVTKAGASYELVKHLLDACAATPGAIPVEVVLCEVGEQGRMLRDGSADVAIMHAPLDVTAGLATKDLVTEGQVAILPAGHALARRSSLSTAEVAEVPGLPIARWPRHDFSYPPGPGPEVHTQSQLAELVALGRTLLVIPESSRAWQWPDHVAVPVLDAPLVTTVLAWREGSHVEGLAALLEAAGSLPGSDERDVVALASHKRAG